MKLLQLPLILVSVITSYGYAESAFEQDESSHHEHHAHEHGVARMNIIGDKNLLSITFTIPMLNVTGFEQTPENDAEQKILDDKIALIEKINQWLTLNQQAGCELTQHSVQIDSENEHPDIDFDIHYQCNKPEQLQTIDVNIFKQLDSLEKIEAQWVIANKQSAKSLTKKEKRIRVTD